MNSKVIFLDWDGTIAKKDVANKAAIIRGKMLGVNFTKKHIQEAQKTHAHYDINKKLISKYTGVTDKKLLTEIMTNLFQYYYLGVVNEEKQDIFYKDMIIVLKEMKKKYGLKLVIVTTLRQDIVEPALQIVEQERLFDAVFGEPADLCFTKLDLCKKAAKKYGKPLLMIGDRKDDIESGRAVGAKTVYCTWGSEDNNHTITDYIIKKPVKLKKIFAELNK